MEIIKLLYFFIILNIILLKNVSGLGRIVGGTETTIEKIPYQASFQFYNGIGYFHYCGASIISTKFLLTAGHCDPGNYAQNYYVRVGSSKTESGGQLLKVAKVTRHPNFNYGTLEYDFAIIEFPQGVEIKLGHNVAIIPLSSIIDSPKDGSMVTVSGWGVASETISSNEVILREVDLPVFNQELCEKVYHFVTPRHLCLGGTPQGGTSACYGDSGGPAVQNGIQYALVSGGFSCSAPNIPGLYARISTARSWITSITGV